MACISTSHIGFREAAHKSTLNLNLEQEIYGMKLISMNKVSCDNSIESSSVSEVYIDRNTQKMIIILAVWPTIDDHFLSPESNCGYMDCVNEK
jgi:hypothetical protein